MQFINALVFLFFYHYSSKRSLPHNNFPTTVTVDLHLISINEFSSIPFFYYFSTNITQTNVHFVHDTRPLTARVAHALLSSCTRQ